MSVRTAMAVGLLGIAALSATVQFPAGAAERIVIVPMPATDVAPTGTRAVAVFAGGCFWGMEAVFSHVKGVQSVVSGYAGGRAADATYDKVSTETTRHAEAVRVTYDPRIVSYATLLRVYFSVAHDPTQLNRQGPDTGTSYRSAVFAQSSDQARTARAYIAQIERARSWGGRLATRIEQGAFFPAEAEHQDFAVRNPDHGYIVRWDAPKVAALKASFPALWSARPVG